MSLHANATTHTIAAAYRQYVKNRLIGESKEAATNNINAIMVVISRIGRIVRSTLYNMSVRRFIFSILRRKVTQKKLDTQVF